MLEWLLPDLGDKCPEEGCGGRIIGPTNGDPLEPRDPYCTECGTIMGRGFLQRCQDCNQEIRFGVVDIDSYTVERTVGIPLVSRRTVEKRYVNVRVGLSCGCRKVGDVDPGHLAAGTYKGTDRWPRCWVPEEGEDDAR